MVRGQVGNYSILKGCLENKSILIVGTGPSWVGFPFLEFRKAGVRILVINHIAKVVRSDYFVSLERQPVDELTRFGFDPYLGVMPVKPEIFQRYGLEVPPDLEWGGIRTICASNAMLEPRNNVAVVNYSKKPGHNPATGFYSNISSGVYAVSAALYMGAKNIFLIGHDGAVESVLHGIDDVAFRGVRKNIQWNYEQMIPAWIKTGEHKNIYNLSSVSLINAFPRLSFEGALKIL